MILEERYILSLLRDEEFNNKLITTLNFDIITDLMIEHKIFMHFYHKINSDVTDKKQKAKINISYMNNIKFKTIYSNFFNEFLAFANATNIDYRIYKGEVLQHIIYDNNQYRMFGDIDMVVKNNDLNEFLIKLNDNFNVVSNNNRIVNLIEEKQIINYKGVNFTIEFKGENHHSIGNKITSLLELNYKKNVVKTYSLEDNFIILSNYFYYFTENINSLRHGQKTIFQYPLDLHCFLQKYKDKIDWNYIKNFSLKNDFAHKIRLCVIKLQKLFRVDYSSLLNKFPIELINYNDSDIVDIGTIRWDIPLLTRFFRQKELLDFLLYNRVGDFLIGESNTKFYEKIEKEITLKNINIKYKIKLIKDTLILNIFNIKLIPKNMVIYLNIFAFDIDGYYLDPYIPITIKLFEKLMLIDQFVISRGEEQRFVADIADKIKTSADNKKVINIDDNKAEIKIFLEQYTIDVNKKIGVNLYAYLFDEKMIFTNKYSLQEHYQKPLLLKKRNI